MCNCKNVEIGTYDNQVTLERPNHMKSREEGTSNDRICVDACIADEIIYLWSLGIRTTGCCCGHNKLPPFIGVIDEDVEAMKNLGYKVQFNPHRPDSEDTFHPKTL